MINVEEAEKIILQSCQISPAVQVSLTQAYGSVLRENIYADRDQPPADRSTMDGIAISFTAWKKGARQFKIAGMQRAGIKAGILKNKNECFEIATGAVLPKNCDCIVPVEQVEFFKNTAFVNLAYCPQQRQFLHRKGADYKKGAMLLRSGIVLNPPQIAVLGAVGKSKIAVSRLPRIAVIGTGDELLEINKRVKDYQSRRSNAYAVESLLALHGFPRVTRFHLPDQLMTLTSALRKIIAKYDVLILSGGVSMGKFDLVPAALKTLKVDVLFHKVTQKPGKPFWFGQTKRGQPVFALPGNPVSTLICAYRYILPYLNKTFGQADEKTEFVRLTENFNPQTQFTFFLPVKLVHMRSAELVAKPAPFAVSGNFASLIHSDGFVQLDPSSAPFRKGKVFQFFRWRE